MRKKVNIFYKTLREWADPAYAGHPYDKRVYREERGKSERWSLNRRFVVR